VLPISVLDTAEVEPNLRFGEAVAAAAERSGRRVLLIASGGMSHRFWPLATIRERAGADPSDISDPALRAYDERIMAWWREAITPPCSSTRTTSAAAARPKAASRTTSCSPARTAEGRGAPRASSSVATKRPSVTGQGETFGSAADYLAEKSLV